MALFLETQSISKEILRIIREAKRRLILVTPYVQTSEILREQIRAKSEKRGLSEFIIIGRDLKSTEYEWMKSIKNLLVLGKNNLHAKCYLNESRAVICSMNLYEYSQQSNIEMGVLITKKDDPEAFKALLSEIETLKHNGDVKINNRPATYHDLTLHQKLNYILINELVSYRLNGDRDEDFEILTTSELISLACSERLNNQSISKILSYEKCLEYCDGILKKMIYAKGFTIGKVIRVTTSPKFKYPKIFFKPLDNNEILLNSRFDNLPKENTNIAVRISGTWFRNYYHLE